MIHTCICIKCKFMLFNINNACVYVCYITMCVSISYFLYEQQLFSSWTVVLWNCWHLNCCYSWRVFTMTISCCMRRLFAVIFLLPEYFSHIWIKRNSKFECTSVAKYIGFHYFIEFLIHCLGLSYKVSVWLVKSFWLLKPCILWHEKFSLKSVGHRPLGSGL